MIKLEILKHCDVVKRLRRTGGQYNHVTNGKTDVNPCYNYYNTKAKSSTDMYSPGFLDSKADQKAIEDGYNKCEETK